MSEPEAGSDVRQHFLPRHPGRRRLGRQRPEDVVLERTHRRPHPAHRPHRRRPGQARRADDVQRARRHSRAGVRRIDTLGGREVNDVYFTDCRLPANAVVGELDRAWPQLMAGLNVERLILAAVLLGLAQRAIDDLLSYVKQRRQFGQPIGTFQVLRHRIADLVTEVECARLLTYHVAQRVDADPDHLLPRDASMAKLKATEVAKSAALEGLQMMGGVMDMPRSTTWNTSCARRWPAPSTADRVRSSATSSARPSVSERASGDE